MENKMTYAMALEVVLNGEEITAEVREKLEALKTSVTKKHSASTKPTATQIENKALCEAILDGMETGVNYTVSDIIKSIEAVNDRSVNKVSALMRMLVTDGKVAKATDKRKTVFYLV